MHMAMVTMPLPFHAGKPHCSQATSDCLTMSQAKYIIRTAALTLIKGLGHLCQGYYSPNKCENCLTSEMVTWTSYFAHYPFGLNHCTS